jgi:RNA polymerase sigma-70 factor (ECF subfamily)
VSDTNAPSDAPRTLDPSRLGEHIPRLMRAAWGLTGSREEAEDLVQEMLVQVLARPRAVRSQEDVGYLLRALRNTFISTRRTADRRPRLAGIDPDEVAGHGARAAAPSAADEAETRRVYAAISALPQHFRDVVVAIDIVGLSYRETSDALGVREATITTRLYRARDRLAKALS